VILFVTIMMTQIYSKLASKFTPAGIVITTTKSVQKDSLDMDLQREQLLPEKARTARSKILFKHGLTIILALGLPSLAFAQSQDTDIRPNANQLTAEEIKSIFSDVTMDGAYNFGRNGKAQSFYTDPGRWFVRQDTLCFMYPSKRLAGGCFRVYQVKNCYYYYSNSRRQVAHETGEPYWIARSTKMGEHAGCAPAIS